MSFSPIHHGSHRQTELKSTNSISAAGFHFCLHTRTMCVTELVLVLLLLLVIVAAVAVAAVVVVCGGGGWVNV